METVHHDSNLESRFKLLLDQEPNVISSVVPANRDEQRAAFRAGTIRNPSHIYPKLADTDQKATQLYVAGQSLLHSGEIPEEQLPVYETFVESFQQNMKLIEAMRAYHDAESDEAREAAAAEFMRINIEINGEPDENVFRSLLHEKLATIRAKQLPPRAAGVLTELTDLLDPADIEGSTEQRFKPSEETVNWVHDVVENLYGGMLAHVDESKTTYTVTELRDLFETILRSEFGEAADQWRVEVDKAQSITVKGVEKRIVIPTDRADMDIDKVKDLVVHELGVHVLRSIGGSQTDLLPLAISLGGHYITEEGLGVVTEQARKKAYKEAGIGLYLAASLAYFKGSDYRDVYEVMWRLSALEKLEGSADLTDEDIDKAQKTADNQTMRIFRGTDSLPWFKDLSYYNGAAKTWEFLESILGDIDRLTLLLLGKSNTSQDHLRVILEAKSH